MIEETKEEEKKEDLQQEEKEKKKEDGIDTQSFAKLMKDVGAQSALREIEKIFGTSEMGKLKEIQKKITELKEGEGQKKDESDEEVLKKIQELEDKLKEKELAHARELNRQQLTLALSKHAPKMPGLILDFFEKEYEVKKVGDSEVVYKKGASLPEQIENKVATIDTFFNFLATESDLSGLFKTQNEAGSHLDTSGEYIDKKNTPIKPEQLKDMEFIKAVEDAGEMTRLISTGRVDMTKIKTKK